jgi:hypothetical protein
MMKYLFSIKQIGVIMFGGDDASRCAAMEALHAYPGENMLSLVQIETVLFYDCTLGKLKTMQASAFYDSIIYHNLV